MDFAKRYMKSRRDPRCGRRPSAYADPAATDRPLGIDLNLKRRGGMEGGCMVGLVQNGKFASPTVAHVLR